LANDKRNQSPEELGEAVGKKIEELFGGMFADDIPDNGATSPAPVEESPPRGQEAKPEPTPSPAPHQPVKTQIEPIEQTPEQELVDQIDARVLQLEWEISGETVNDLLALFKEMEKSLSQDPTMKSLLAMNSKVVQRLGRAGVTPQPSCFKFLQDSVETLRAFTGANTAIESPEKSVNNLKAQYQQIMAASVDPASSKGGDPAARLDSLVENLGISSRSLGEISQRLARILAVFRQGGDMSGEEITRRLGTLEKLLAENVSSVSSIQKDLLSLDLASAGGDPKAAKPDGVLMIACGASPLAIPSSLVKALFPLTPEQAKPLVGKSSITLGAGPVPRLPIKLPQSSQSKAPPTALVHLALSNREFFLLADRSLGYRTAPAGVDLMKQPRVKIGATNYALLNPAAMKLA
jgi:hypothetical protein